MSFSAHSRSGAPMSEYETMPGRTCAVARYSGRVKTP